MDNDNGKHVYEMNEEEMNELADTFAHCAAHARKCGLDGMVIHCGHGFLFSQWVSRRFNKRTDKYGGSMENRARFPIMCLQRIRQAVGDDFLIKLRFSVEENISPICDEDFFDDTVTIEETVAFFKVLDQYPGLLDIAHITGGLHTVPVYNTRVTANSLFPLGVNVEGAAAVKAAVKHIKVGVVGSMSDPELCERVIAEGKTDFVIMCRQLLMADPAFPNKAQSGHTEDINNCLRCILCHANDHCTVNPENILLGEDDPLALTPASAGKRLAVIGGGIGGMKAAEYAAQSGHSVVLYEQTDSLGGILKYSDHDIFKQDIHRFKSNMILRLKQNPSVEIRLDCKATPEMIKAEGFDAVIVAIGGKPKELPVPGSDKAMDAVAAYLNEGVVQNDVAIIGGGLTGCEAAIHWAEKGKNVTLISRSKELMRTFQPRLPADGSPDAHMVLLYKLGVTVFKGYACEEITGGGVWTRSGEERSFVSAGTIINASGMSPDPSSAERFQAAAPFCRAIGDVVKANLTGDATLGARTAIVELNKLT